MTVPKNYEFIQEAFFKRCIPIDVGLHTISPTKLNIFGCYIFSNCIRIPEIYSKEHVLGKRTHVTHVLASHTFQTETLSNQSVVL